MLRFGLQVDLRRVFDDPLNRHLYELVERVELLAHESLLVKIRTDDDPARLLPEVGCDLGVFIVLKLCITYTNIINKRCLQGWWPAMDWIGLCSALRPLQHSIGYMGDGFYRSKDPTNSNKNTEGSYKGKQKQHKEHSNGNMSQPAQCQCSATVSSYFTCIVHTGPTTGQASAPGSRV